MSSENYSLLGTMRLKALDLASMILTHLCNYYAFCPTFISLRALPGSATVLVTTPRWSGQTLKSSAVAWSTMRRLPGTRRSSSATMPRVETGKVVFLQLYWKCIPIHVNIRWLYVCGRDCLLWLSSWLLMRWWPLWLSIIMKNDNNNNNKHIETLISTK